MEKNINLKEARVGELIDLKEIDNWNQNDCILIEAQTGRGKTFFIQKNLNVKAKPSNKKILLLSPRSALKRQNEKSLSSEGEDNITCMNYQILEKKILDKECVGYFDYIVADECHYIYSDSGFNRCTDLTWKWLKSQEKSTKIFMSATINLFEKCLDRKEKIVYKDYRLEANYNYINNFFFYENDGALKKMLSELPEDEKAIYFAGTKKAYDMSQEFDNAEFYCSKYNPKYYKYANKDIENEIDEEVKDLSCKILCTTSVLDAGVNIRDKSFKHIIVDIFDIDTIVQAVGRRRIDNYKYINDEDRVNIYIKNQKGNSLTTIYNNIKKEVDQGNYLIKNDSIAFAKKYKKDKIYEIVDQIVVNENGTEKIEYELNEMRYIKYLNDIADLDKYREHKNEYMADIRLRFNQKKKNTKMLEDYYDAITLEDKLNKMVSMKMFEDERVKFKEFIMRELFNAPKANHGSLGLKPINALFEEKKLNYKLDSKEEKSRKSNNRGKRYWILGRIVY